MISGADPVPLLPLLISGAGVLLAMLLNGLALVTLMYIRSELKAGRAASQASETLVLAKLAAARESAKADATLAKAERDELRRLITSEVHDRTKSIARVGERAGELETHKGVCNERSGRFDVRLHTMERILSKGSMAAVREPSHHDG